MQGDLQFEFELGVCENQTRAWLEWIAAHKKDDPINIAEFESFAPGLLIEFSKEQKDMVRWGDKSSLNRSVYDRLRGRYSYYRLNDAVVFLLSTE
jgi:hypothetical protein